MCGISALFDLRAREKTRNGDSSGGEARHADLYAKLDRSVQLMRHRGPDAKGIWISQDHSVGLAHVRLSTRDLSSAGHQPLHSSDETDDVHIAVNGELYYDPSLRAELGQDYKFQSTSDSEMVIALYRRYGTAFIDHLRGEFSLIVYDGREQILVAARDRFGVKPLHYGEFDGKLVIATQAKGIMGLLEDGERMCWDPLCLAQGGGHYGSRTLFQNVQKLPAGHMLIARPLQSEKFELKPYWRMTYPANEGGNDSRSVDEVKMELREQLLEAVRLRLFSSDVPVGLLLSGGVDSSAIAGMAAALSRQQLAENDCGALPLPVCFTITFPDQEDLDESATASRTAEHLGLPIETVPITEQVLADEFEETCWLGETLLWDLQHVAKKALARYIHKRGFKVVLNGDGSDEMFGGYSFFAADRLEADDQARATSSQTSSTEQREHLRDKSVTGTKWYGMENAQTSDRSEAAQKLNLPPSFTNLAISRHDDWLLAPIRQLSNPSEAIHESLSPTDLDAMKTYHPLHRAMLAWNTTLLPNMIIAAISDGSEMAHSIESRPPFLDHVVAEYAQTLPVDLLVHLDSEKRPVEKWILREAVRPYITDEVYTKTKHAFAAPFRYAVGGPLHAKLAKLITRENVERLGFADWGVCGNVLERAYEEKDELLFRKAIWLAQIVILGQRFGVQTWKPAEATAGGVEVVTPIDQRNGHT